MGSAGGVVCAVGRCPRAGRWRLPWLPWLALLLALVGAPARAQPPARPPLSEAATQWLAAHPRWRVGVVRDWMPIDGVDAQGRHTGASAEVLAEAAALLGVRVDAVPFDDFSQALDAARRGGVELLSSTARTPQRERDLHFTQGYLRVPVAYIARRDSTDFSEADDFGGRTVAVERGYRVADLLRERFPAVRRLEVETTPQALQAVADGRADVYRGALTPAHYLIEQQRIAGLRVLATPRLEPTQLTFASREPGLVDALDAALRALGEQRLADIERRWQPAYTSLGAARPPRAAASRLPGVGGELRVAYDAGFAPFSATGADGSAQGLAVEMFRRSADAAGLRYRFIACDRFAAALDALRQRRADVVVAAVRTPERLAGHAFVGPYHSAPAAIIGRVGHGWPGLGALAGRRVALDEEHYLIPSMRREQPTAALEIVPTAAGVLEAVDEGRADAGITNIEVASLLVAQRYVGRLQVSGVVEGHPSDLYFMVERDRPELAEALRLGFEAVPEDERRALANTLLRTHITVGTDRRTIALVVGPLLAGLTGLWLASAWSARRLRASERRARAESERARLSAQLRADFVADMSHEVRTPLVALAEGLRLLDREPMPAPARRVLAPLVSSSNRLVGLLNTLLDFARLDHGRLELSVEPVQPSRLVPELVAAFEPMACAKGLRLQVRVDPALPPLMLDPYRVQQVLNNLVSNALKFTDRGEVSVTLDGEPDGPAAWRLTLRVRDTGTGMDAALRERLFTRFEQAPGVARQRGGSGLGLAIVHCLVQSARGTIEVRSQPGEGSEFTVRVRARAARPDTAAPAGPPAPRRVLLVDDDPVNLLVFAEHLREAGLEVRTAQSVADAGRRLAEQRPDLVLTDLDLGAGGLGTELAAQAAAGDGAHTLPLVVLSGDDPPAQLPPGVLGWLQKPRHPDDRAWLQAVERIAAGLPSSV